MTTEKLREQLNIVRLEQIQRELARRQLLAFTTYTFPAYQVNWYHDIYAKILDQFIKGNMKKVMISMPPQHGKTELSTRRLPAYMLGKYKGKRGVITSYNATKAQEFSLDVQRIIADEIYNNVFDDTYVPGTAQAKELGLQFVKLKNRLNHFETMNKLGQKTGDLKAVGRGGALTGNPLDFIVMDDLYKDYKEGNSPIIRQAVIDWYTSVVRTRMHNLSQELIVFTRWHEEDLIGFIEKNEEFEELTTLKQLLNPDPFKWYKINFAALKMQETSNEFDKREIGEALWADMHNEKKLESFKQLDPEKFESLYQGDPQPMVGLLYTRPFNTYILKPKFRGIYNYTDTADEGSDYLCSIDYGVGIDDNIYILDIVYTQEPQEQTEKMVADMIVRDGIHRADIESNNGGKAFARSVDRLSKFQRNIEWFFQGDNKESRIISNSANVLRKIYFPLNWEGRWPIFYKHLTRFKKNFKSNEHDDAPDALTGVYEMSGLDIGNDVLWR